MSSAMPDGSDFVSVLFFKRQSVINPSKATGFRDESASNDGLWPHVKVRTKSLPWADVWLRRSLFCGWAMPDGVDFLRTFLHASIRDKSVESYWFP